MPRYSERDDDVAITDVFVPIRVVNFNEFSNQTPVLTNVVDNQVLVIPDGQNFILDVDATDGDVAQDLLYSLTGRDASLFKIDRETGELTTAAVLASTLPRDQDGNNQYELTVGVHDRLSFDAKHIVVEFASN
ncbi:MAG: cadherin repeat domain-containing protein [Planctomycetaceae bacterium]